MSKNLLELIINFLNTINISVVKTDLSADTFLPGLQLKGSVILVDVNKLKYPGDLLHEAGHVAVTQENLRPLIGTTAIGAEWPSQGDEIAAILWSYAALHYLNLDPKIVFHDHGYKNASGWFIEQFTNGVYMGLPLLDWMGFCEHKDDFPKLKNGFDD